MTVILNFLDFLIFFLKKIKKRNINDKGNKQIAIKPILVSQNLGFLIVIL